MTRKEWQVVERAQNKALGLCRCGRTRARRRLTCRKCITWEAERRARVVKEGWCPQCKVRPPSRGARTCLRCRKMHTAKRKAMRDAWIASRLPPVEPPQLTPDESKLVKLLSGMELEISALANALDVKVKHPVERPLAGELRQSWARILCDITTAHAVLTVLKKRPRVPGRLKSESTSESTRGSRKQKT